MPNPDTRAVETVTQEDRKSAHDLAQMHFLYTEQQLAQILAGELDHISFVQAFARHRIAAEARVSAREEDTIENTLAGIPAGWSWSLGQMMGLPPERRYRCFLSDHNTPDGKAARHVCEDRPSTVEAIHAAIAETRAALHTDGAGS